MIETFIYLVLWNKIWIGMYRFPPQHPTLSDFPSLANLVHWTVLPPICWVIRFLREVDDGSRVASLTASRDRRVGAVNTPFYLFTSLLHFRPTIWFPMPPNHRDGHFRRHFRRARRYISAEKSPECSFSGTEICSKSCISRHLFTDGMASTPTLGRGDNQPSGLHWNIAPTPNLISRMSV